MIEPDLPKFDRTMGDFVISEEDQRIGTLAHHLYLTELKRVPTLEFMVLDGQEQVILNRGTRMERVITEDDIKGEDISEETSSAINGFSKIEALLPHFMFHAIGRTRSIRGIHNLYLQWGSEELEHELILSFISKHHGFKTEQELDSQYYENLSNEWKTPYPGVRMMFGYTCMQESATHDNYEGLERSVRKEGALHTADLLGGIKRVEGGHLRAFLSLIKLWAIYDPDGTKKDILHAVREFSMPGETMLKQRREARNMAVLSGYSKATAARAVRKTLHGLPGVTKDEIEDTVKLYVKDPS